MAQKKGTVFTCAECGNSQHGQATQKFCSSRCQSVFYRRKQGLYTDRTVECEQCGVRFITGRSRQRYCCNECRKADYNAKWRGVNQTDRQISRGSVGTISELLVAADLLNQGYEVFRAVSPSCSCDLAVLKDGELLRIEVTTAYVGPSGKIQSPHKDCDKSDVVAYVMKVGKEITYEPALDFNPKPNS